jgi:hypothetical protein
LMGVKPTEVPGIVAPLFGREGGEQYAYSWQGHGCAVVVKSLHTPRRQVPLPGLACLCCTPSNTRRNSRAYLAR